MQAELTFFYDQFLDKFVQKEGEGTDTLHEQYKEGKTRGTRGL